MCIVFHILVTVIHGIHHRYGCQVTRGIKGNETVDQLARFGSGYSIIGPEPVEVAKKVVRAWTKKDHKIYQEFITGMKHAKGSPKRTLSKRTRRLLNLNRKLAMKG
jgi:hypothetical protein